MSSVTKIYIETSWETMTVPYYDPEKDKVYFCYWTSNTALKSGETWNQLFKKHEKDVIKIFQEKEWSRLFAPIDSSSSQQATMPLFPNSKEKICDDKNKKDFKEQQLSGKIEYSYATVDPRPVGVVKLLYVIKFASSLLDIKKVVDDWNNYQSSQSVPPSLKKPKDKDFNIENYKDFKKVKDISSLSDFNKFTAASIQKARSARMAAKLGVVNAAQAGNINFADEIRTTLSEDIKVTSFSISSDSLTASKTVFDSYQGTLNVLTSTSETLKKFGLNDEAKELEKMLKQMRDKASILIQFVNKWGLMGLLECTLAHLISNLELAGKIEEARLFALELKKLQENVGDIAVEFDEYGKLFEKIISISSPSSTKQNFSKKIKEEMKAALVETVKHLIQMVTQACLLQLADEPAAADKFNYGVVDASNIPNNVNIIPPLPDLPDSPDKPQGKVPTLQEINDFLNNLLGSLNKAETCRLFTGTADNKLLHFIHQYIIATYPQLKAVFPNTQSISSYFYNLGLQMDTTFCKPSENSSTPNNNLVEYCGSKINEELVEIYKEKLPDSPNGAPGQMPFSPNINLEDIQEVFSPDFFNKLVPPLDYLPFLKDSYRSSQEDLYSYEALFNEDYTKIYRTSPAESLSGLTDEEVKQLKEAGLKTSKQTVELASQDLNDVTTSVKLTQPSYNDVSKEIAKEPLEAASKGAADAGLEFAVLAGGDFNAVNIIKDGSFDIEATTPSMSLPYTGSATNNAKNPLTTIGSLIDDEDVQEPAFRNIGFNDAGPEFSVLDYYRDVVASFLDEYLKQFKEDYKEKTIPTDPDKADVIFDFYRIDRRERIREVLCDAKDKKSEAEGFAADEQKAMDLESIRILVYILLIENFPNFMIAENLGLPVKLSPEQIKKVRDDFVELCEDAVIDIPVRDVLCDAGLDITTIIEQELQFALKQPNKTFVDVDVDKILLDVLQEPEQTETLAFSPSTSLTNFVKNYKVEVYEDFAFVDYSWQKLYDNMIYELINVNNAPKLEEKDYVTARAMLQAAADGKTIQIESNIIPDVFRIFLCSLYLMLFLKNQEISSVEVKKTLSQFLTTSTYQTLIKPTVVYQPKYLGDTSKTYELFSSKPVTENTKIKPLLIQIIDGQQYVNEEIDDYKKVYRNLFKTIQKVGVGSLFVRENKTVNAVEKIKQAFNKDFLKLLLAYKLYAWVFSELDKQLFEQTKAAIISRFSVGTPVLATFNDSVEKYNDQVKKLNKANLSMKELSPDPLWLLMIMLIPKLIFTTLKSLIMAGIYFASPVLYLLIMLADSMGLSLEEFLNKMEKDSLEEIKDRLPDDDPSKPLLQKRLENNKEKSTGAIEELVPEKCPT